jgi:hypothetical protein
MWLDFSFRHGILMVQRFNLSHSNLNCTQHGLTTILNQLKTAKNMGCMFAFDSAHGSGLVLGHKLLRIYCVVDHEFILYCQHLSSEMPVK